MSGDRRLPPSARKLARARARGEVALSPLVSAVAATAAGGLAFTFGLEASLGHWRALFASLVTDSPSPTEALTRAAHVGLLWLGPPVGAAALAGAFVAFAQVGPLFSLEAIRPRAERLSPSAAIAQLGDRGLAALGGSALVVLLVALVLSTLSSAFASLAGRALVSLSELARGAAGLLETLGARALALLAVAAIVALAHARHAYLRSQRMSRAELLREQRETEGEPLARRRRAEAMRRGALGPPIDVLTRRALWRVEGAGFDVIVGRAEDGRSLRVLGVLRGQGAARSRALTSEPKRVRDQALAAALARVEGPLDATLTRRLERHRPDGEASS